MTVREEVEEIQRINRTLYRNNPGYENRERQRAAEAEREWSEERRRKANGGIEMTSACKRWLAQHTPEDILNKSLDWWPDVWGYHLLHVLAHGWPDSSVLTRESCMALGDYLAERVGYCRGWPDGTENPFNLLSFLRWVDDVYTDKYASPSLILAYNIINNPPFPKPEVMGALERARR